jgi:hypothetical protein
MFAGISLTFKETMSGHFSVDPTGNLSFDEAESQASCLDKLIVDLEVGIPDFKVFLEDSDHKGIVNGRIRFSDYGEGFEIQNGEFRLFNKDVEGTKHLEYKFEFTNSTFGNTFKFHGIKNIKDDAGLDSITDITTLFVTIEVFSKEESRPDTVYKGKIYFQVYDFPALFASIETHGTTDRGISFLAKVAFLDFCTREMLSTYVIDKLKNALG